MAASQHILASIVGIVSPSLIIGSVLELGEYIMAISFGLGLGVTLVPDATQHMPAFLKLVVATPITLAGLSAILLTLALPEDTAASEIQQAASDGDADTHFTDTQDTPPVTSISTARASTPA